MWTEWTLATRFLLEGKRQSLLILGGIAIGVAVIVFLSALIGGLQDNLIERTLGTQAHIKLQAPDEVNQVLPVPAGTAHLVLEDRRPQRLRSINNWQQLRDTLDQQPELVAVSPVISGPGIAHRGEARESVVLMGIDTPRYLRIIPVQRSMVAGSFRVGAGDAVIGNELAYDLGVRVGDKIRLDTGLDNETVLNITGIFSLGVRELDARYVYLEMKQAQALLALPGAATVIDLTVRDIFGADAIAARIGRLTGQKAESWMQTNAQLMNALQSQSMSSRMISAFVAISVAFGIASVLSVSVVQRTREIGILRAMGTSAAQMLRVFLLQGALFGLGGSLLGGALGAGMLWAFNTFGPRLFSAPVSWQLLLAASALATLSGLAAAAIPARRAAAMDPVEAIRHV